MSDATLDRGVYFSSAMPDWYRERPFKVAFAVSLVIHATLIALIPSFRTVPIEMPRVLEVEIVPIQVPPTVPRIQERPVVQQKTVEPQVEPIAKPAVRQPEPKAEPVVTQPQPEPPPVPRADIIQTPRAEPKAEFVVPKAELRPEPKSEPRLEARPVPRIEPRPEPPPVAQVEPKPRPMPTVVPRPEPQPEPRTEIRSEPQPAPPLSPLPDALPRVEPTVVPRPPATVVLPPSAVSPESPPPIVATAPLPTGPKQQLDSPRDRALEKRYTDSITALVQRHVNYPIYAKQQRWEGTTVLTLTLAPDGNVKAVSVFASSGRDILDQAALKMVKQASPLPRAPEELRGEERTVKLPISFKLPNS